MSEFKDVSGSHFIHLYFYGRTGEVSLEDLYQEFKARMLEEARAEKQALEAKKSSEVGVWHEI